MELLLEEFLKPVEMPTHANMPKVFEIFPNGIG
jgi:hypothetical protein